MAPQPPPPGGVATLGRQLALRFGDDPRVVIHDPNEVHGSRTPGRAIRNAWALLRLVRRHRAEHVFAFSSAGWSFWEKCGWMALAQLAGARTTVMMVDGRFPAFFAELRRPARSLASWLLGRFETVAAQSPSWASYYRSLARLRDVVVVGAGVDTELYAPAPEMRSEPVRVLFVGSCDEAKGVRELLDSARVLHGRGVDFELRLVGQDHGAAAWVAEFVDQHDLADRVTMLGALDEHEVLREYRAASVFVLPSRAEGFPNALLEAMASGLVPVTTKVGAIADVVSHGENGFLIPIGKADVLAATLEHVVGSERLRAQVGARARETIEAGYTLSHSMADYAALFHRLLDTGR